MKIIKRNGTEVDFDASKILNAIIKANNTISDDAKISDELIQTIAEQVCTECESFTHTPHVEEVQDLVEQELLNYAPFKLAKAYMNYRYKRELERSNYKKLMSNIGEKLTASNVQNQNANVDEYSFGGRIGEANDIVMKEYALNYCMSKKSRETIWGILRRSGVNAYMGIENAEKLDRSPLISSCIENGETALYTVYNETGYPVEDCVVLPQGEYIDFTGKKHVGTNCADGVKFDIKLKAKETVVFLKRW
jgi:transcriptional regulator NrdR family protein